MLCVLQFTKCQIYVISFDLKLDGSYHLLCYIKIWIVIHISLYRKLYMSCYYIYFIICNFMFCTFNFV